ncbi:MAG: transketolase [Flexilinea sp.]
MEENEIRSLKKKANQMRKYLVELSHRTGVLHIGGDLSSTDIVTALFQYKMRIDPKNPKWPKRDRFIISKGHGGATEYVAQAMIGMVDFDELFSTYRQLDSRFGMHPCSNVLNTLDVSTGSLGHGLPIAVGMALAARIDYCDYRVYVLMGDGETNEGSIWEAAMAARHFGLGNLVGIVDYNHLSLDGLTKDVMNMDPYADKWRSFGWNVIEINGNNMQQICDALDEIPESLSDIPTLILADTVKGKGIDFMENSPKWHAGVLTDPELYNACMDCLDKIDAESEV